jgi:hypothetical protein
MGTRGILLAWLAGIGLITWRSVKRDRKPVSPGQYAAASGLYVLLALVAEYQPAAPVAVLTAWGFDLAVFLQVLPSQVGGPGKAPPPRPATGPRPTAG